jgi:hypothetical protein
MGDCGLTKHRIAALHRQDQKAMTVPVEVKEISGAAELHDWFGYWPIFHDAEIISLHLNREGSSSLRVHTWEMTKESG